MVGLIKDRRGEVGTTGFKEKTVAASAILSTTWFKGTCADSAVSGLRKQQGSVPFFQQPVHSCFL